jgi:hypothetical protein
LPFPQAEPAEDPHPEPQVLAPQGLQLDAQGAEQHLLVFLPKQPPAWADAVIATATANVKNKRIVDNPPKIPELTTTTKKRPDTPSGVSQCE